MGKVVASITTSVDGYVTGPDDGPECGLGKGGAAGQGGRVHIDRDVYLEVAKVYSSPYATHVRYTVQK